MNETLELIMKRFSCRAYTDEPVPNEDLALIGQAALASPTAMNQQNFRITLVRDKSIINTMDQQGMEALKAMEDQSTYQRFMDRGGLLFYNAPAMFVISIQKGSETDLGIVAQNIVLAATSLGLGSCHCGMARLLFQGPNQQKYESLMQFPQGFTFGLAVLIGHAAKQGTPHAPDISKFISIG